MTLPRSRAGRALERLRTSPTLEIREAVPSARGRTFRRHLRSGYVPDQILDPSQFVIRLARDCQLQPYLSGASGVTARSRYRSNWSRAFSWGTADAMSGVGFRCRIITVPAVRVRRSALVRATSGWPVGTAGLGFSVAISTSTSRLVLYRVAAISSLRFSGGQIWREQPDRGECQSAFLNRVEQRGTSTGGAGCFDAVVGRILSEVQHLGAVGEQRRTTLAQVEPSRVEFHQRSQQRRRGLTFVG